MINPNGRPLRNVARMRRLLLVPVVLVLFAAGASAEGPTLFGTVGPGFSIRLADAAGNPVKHLDPGAYTIQIQDKSDVHNFHLAGPGVDQATDIEPTGTFTWTVTFADGVYGYRCDAHPSTMVGAFAVGTAVLPTSPPVKKPVALAASVGPGAKITVGRLGVRIKTVVAGPVVLTVSDRSPKDNFHLSGPGVNRATSMTRKGTFVWKLTLKSGMYVYRSDATPTLRGTFKAV